MPVAFLRLPDACCLLELPRPSSLFGERFEQSEAIERLERFLLLPDACCLVPICHVIDTFFRRRYFFRKRLRVFQISDSELGGYSENRT